MEKSLGRQIREARLRRRLTQEELAAKLGYSRSNVSHWENDNAVPDETVLAIIEEVLECRFEREEEIPPQMPEEEEAASAAPSGDKGNNFIHAALRVRVPAWVAAAVCAVCLTVVVGMLGTIGDLRTQLRAAKEEKIEPYTPGWYYLEDERQEGKAYLTLTVEPNPVKLTFDAAEAGQYAWFYNVRIEESGGIAFNVEEIEFRDFYDDTVRNFRTWKSDHMAKTWGSNTIPANEFRSFRGGLTAQRVTNSGVVVRGTDANGNELEFRGMINYSQEKIN